MIDQLQAGLQKSLEHFRAELAKIQTGRANSMMVDGLMVESYGSKMPLKSIASVSVPEAQTLRIEPWDKTVLGAIEKAIQEARLGLNPQNMGEYILVPVPPMTEDRRKGIVKLVHSEKENTKIVIRNLRHDAMRGVKAQKDEKEISDDEAVSLDKKIQDHIDQANAEIDDIASKKETDILKV